MGFTVKPDGAIMCDTLEDALKVSQALQGAKPHPRQPELMRPLSLQRPSALDGTVVHAANNGHSVRTPFMPKSVGPLIKLLVAIRAAPDRKIAAQELAKQMGLDEAKGLGGYQAMANVKLTQIGFKTREVLLRSYSKEGQSFWEAGPLIESAIESLDLLKRMEPESKS